METHNAVPSPYTASSNAIPPHVLTDLCSRFIINVPEEERQDLIRIFFQIELAHWFYLDFYCQDSPDLKPCGIKDFSAQVFHHCPFLQHHATQVEKIFEDWREYKMAVPTYGAIMLDPSLTEVVMVQGFWAKTSWMFPKGKVNEGEAADVCAVREVLEETGFDTSDLIDPEAFLEHRMNDQLARLYIIPNVPKETHFEPRTRKEIKRIDWFKLEDLPSHKKDMTSKEKTGLNPNSFFMVIPFIRQLKKWIARKQGKPEYDMSMTPTSALKNSRRNSKSLPREQSAGNVEKDKARQQQQFAQQNQQVYQELVKIKTDGKGKSRDSGRDNTRTRSESPRAQKDNQRQFQILRRDGTVTGSTRRALANQFTESSEDDRPVQQQKPRHRSRNKEQFSSPTWMNFKLDTESIMACL
ncbi:m7GpppN-mRNA hydrolase-like [Lineus longissimus]|uniref:m7GpppN-mRNA hydrolase-like n=1 Tax=Lineus longissimus TaxID=88925 RepID=UPI002B4F1AA0